MAIFPPTHLSVIAAQFILFQDRFSMIIEFPKDNKLMLSAMYSVKDLGHNTTHKRLRAYYTADHWSNRMNGSNWRKVSDAEPTMHEMNEI